MTYVAGTPKIYGSRVGCACGIPARYSYARRVLVGAPLWKILAAGEWRSPAFLDYLDVHKMEVDLVLQGHLDEESESDVG